MFKALGVERPHVVGHSLRGLIALRLGQAGLTRSVTAFAPAGFWTGLERRYTYTADRRPPRGTAAAWASSGGSGPHCGRPAVLTGTLYGRAELCPPDAVVAALRALRDSAAFQATLSVKVQLTARGLRADHTTITWRNRHRFDASTWRI